MTQSPVRPLIHPFCICFALAGVAAQPPFAFAARPDLPTTLRQRVVTDQGIFLVYDAPISAGTGENGPYLAWWRDLRSNELYLYDRLLLGPTDVEVALDELQALEAQPPIGMLPNPQVNLATTLDDSPWQSADLVLLHRLVGLPVPVPAPDDETPQTLKLGCEVPPSTIWSGPGTTNDPPALPVLYEPETNLSVGDHVDDVVAALGCGCEPNCHYDPCRSCVPSCTPDNGCYYSFCACTGICYQYYKCVPNDDECGGTYCVNESCQFVPRICNDGSECTADKCVSGSGCAFTWDCVPPTDPCIIRSCDVIAGTPVCVTENVNCDDHNGCTTDSCNPTNGQCINESTCIDPPSICTDRLCVPDGSGGSQCLTIQLNCDDGNPCTTDHPCDPQLGCTHTWLCPEPSDACTQRGCDDGNCIEEPRDCDDENPCTIDDCVISLGGCRHRPKCDDNNKCTTDPCVDGVCQPHLPVCNDNNPCTSDLCSIQNNAAVCNYVPLDCTVCPTGRCQGGSCVSTGCNVSLTSGAGKPCGTVTLTLGRQCWPNCGSMSIQIEPVYPPGVSPFLSISSAFSLYCGGANNPQPIIVTIAEDAPASTVTLLVTGTTSMGTQCQAQASVTVTKLTITAQRIDQDEPTNTAWTALAELAPVYGGSEASTADNLRLTVVPSGGSVATVAWTYSGPGGGTWSSPPTGPTATTWDLGDILNPMPGEIEFKATITYTDGTRQCGKFKSEIGVRTDDVIVVGWIDPALVPLAPTIAVDSNILTAMPPTGVVTNISHCTARIAWLSEGLVSVPGPPPAIPSPTDPLLAPKDRDYLLQWLFHFGQDNFAPTFGPPPSDFRTSNVIDQQKVQQFFVQTTKYKVFAQLQIRYLVDLPGQRFKEPPIFLRWPTAVGETRNPCGFSPIIPPFVDPIPAQTGPATTPLPVISPQSKRVSLIVDGSPDAPAVRAFDTLMGVGVLESQFWENVGARITFQWNGGTSPELVYSPFPSFYVYRNGLQVSVIPQVPVKDHFYGPGDANYPVYPFGTVVCPTCPASSCAIFFAIPDSRCGDAASPAHPSARIPPYTVP